MSAPKKPLSYGEYLRLERLLDCQHLESAKRGAPVHDEHLFIIVHQAYELWFKQILHELDAIRDIFARPTVAERDVGRAVSHLGRIVEIERLLLAQVDVLETMTPLDFLEFRGLLAPASGIQSLQFRLVENKLGIPREGRVEIEGVPYSAYLGDADRKRLQDCEGEPPLLALIDEWLARTPFLSFGGFDFWHEYRKAVDGMLGAERARIEAEPEREAGERARRLARFAGTTATFEALFDREKHDALRREGRRRLSHRALLAAVLINLYRDEPILHLPYRLLTLLVDVDEGLTTWRYRHALMVRRMIGTKMGTGGTSGVDYLRETAERHKVFVDLIDLSTFLIPRSALPKLPADVERTMSFHYTAG
ncbi:MAG: tryptophan 2,3-dioxygenase family protein [bacterium]